MSNCISNVFSVVYCVILSVEIFVNIIISTALIIINNYYVLLMFNLFTFQY